MNALKCRIRPSFANSVIFCALLVAFFSFTACAEPAWNSQGASLSSYVEKGGSLVVNLTRDGKTLIGSWEDRTKSRYGLIYGEVDEKGGMSLEFHAVDSNRVPGSLEANYAPNEKRIVGKLKLDPAADARDVILVRDSSITKGLELAVLQGEERGSLAEEEESSRFAYDSIEVASPAALRDWYRTAFQNSKDAKTAMEAERDTFFEDFRTESKSLLEKAGAEAVHPWYYDGRQFIAFRNSRLLVLGLRLLTFTGGTQGMHGIRYAIIDLKEKKMLGGGDFFAPGSTPKLAALLDARARDRFGLPEDVPLSEAGFLADNIGPTANFLVYKGGIAFHYNVNEIAPFAMGDIWLELTFEELGELLAPGVLKSYGLGLPAARGSTAKSR